MRVRSMNVRWEPTQVEGSVYVLKIISTWEGINRPITNVFQLVFDNDMFPKVYQLYRYIAKGHNRDIWHLPFIRKLVLYFLHLMSATIFFKTTRKFFLFLRNYTFTNMNKVLPWLHVILYSSPFSITFNWFKSYE